MRYEIPESDDGGLCMTCEPSPFDVTYDGDDSIIDRGIAYVKAGGKCYTLEEFKIGMRAVIDGVRNASRP